MKQRIKYIVAIVMMAFTSVPIVSPTVSAQPANIDCSDQSSEGLKQIRDFYRRNDITGYDVCAQLIADYCPPGGTATSTVPAGGSNGEKLFKYLVNKGLTAKQAAGILGNVMQESGGGTFNINPTATNPTSGAYGIVQWYAARKTGLISYASRMSKPASDLGIQMDFLWIELNGIYKSNVLDPIKATSDLRSPTRIFLEKFEIPCKAGTPECAKELTNRMVFSQAALDAFGDLAPEELAASDVTDPSCSGNESAGVVDASGYAFPVVLSKSLVSNGYSWPCKTTAPYCHHDGTPAFDLSKKPDNRTAGVPIVSIYAGTITKIGMNYKGTGCQSIQYKDDNGKYYWYGHIRTDSKTPSVNTPISAGTYLGRVGESLCTGNGSYPHLHIDMGLPGRTAGNGPDRDPAFIPLMNALYEKLPESL